MGSKAAYVRGLPSRQCKRLEVIALGNPADVTPESDPDVFADLLASFFGREDDVNKEARIGMWHAARQLTNSAPSSINQNKKILIS